MATKKTTKKKVGRKPIKVTPALCKKVERLAAGGRTEKQIAQSLNMAYSTLSLKKKEFLEFSEAIKKGQAKAICEIENTLFVEASDGNTAVSYTHLTLPTTPYV